MLVYETPGGQVSLNEIVWFSRVLRTFEGGAFTRRLLFRGAWAWGDFYLVSPDTNTVLGPAVRDVARWYDSADWIGIHATPRTSILVQALIDRGKATIDFVLLDYNVPMKDGTEVTLKAVNWPKNLNPVPFRGCTKHPRPVGRQLGCRFDSAGRRARALQQPELF